IAVATVGIYCLATTLVWGRLVYGIPLPLEHPLAFLLAIPATLISVGVLGFALCMVLVRFRWAGQIGNSLEYPVWIVSGLLFPILFFAFLGRAAGLENDRFYLIGNALQVGALPGLFAMTFAIAGERWFQTLSPVLATPANRAAIFLGRALPVIANAAFVCVV